MDNYYAKYEVSYPFQIRRFRSLHDWKWDSTNVFSGEAHNFWEFMVVLEGELELVEEQNVYILKPGNLLCTAPMEFHRNRSHNGTSPHVLNFSFEHDGTVPPILKEGIFRLSPTELEELKGIFYQLADGYARVKDDPSIGAEGALAMASFFLRLARRNVPQKTVSMSHSVNLYRRLVETMKAAVYENVSVQEIAARNDISVGTMKNLFRTYAGIGPKNYYSDMRGIQALSMLENGMEINEIAETLNYSSPNYFSLCFKKQFGMPPGQYRKEHPAGEK